MKNFNQNDLQKSSKPDLNTKSITPTNSAKIKDAINTKVELACKSENFGQVTCCVTSIHEALIKSIIMFE